MKETGRGERLVYKTHHVAAFFGAQLWLMHVHQPVLEWPTAVALLGAYLMGPAADVDQPQSYVGHRMRPIAGLLSGLGIRHRTLTHSLLFLVGLWIALQLLPVPDIVRQAIWIGYASHPLIDLLNEEGVELFWPLPVRIRFLPRALAIPVDSFRETVLRGGLTACSFGLLLLYTHPVIAQLPIVGPVVDGIVRWGRTVLDP
ncbi:MAG: metal-dependent hydrolase [Alicyclobacillaceae bacterium]|nr:metal-dependent hydrolase [Alicyclobacillaceae bacterium]